MARILVTGASTGLGLLTATTLADAGHEVVLHARNPHRIDDTSVLNRMLASVHGDLADPDETRGVAEQANRFGRFDAVIHNAGVMDRSATLAVNIVAPYLLTALMDRPRRVIALSSSMHLGGSPDLGRLTGGRPVSYEDSKLYVTAFAFALARLWPDVLAHAVCPGWVPTRMGGRRAPDDLTEGHRTQEWLATAAADEIRPRSGGYWHHGEVRRAHPAASDPAFQDALLDALRTRTGVTLPA